MPLARIDLIKGRPVAYRRTIGEVVYKAMIEIPPGFFGKPPVNPTAREKIGVETGWTGAQGLSVDIRH